MASPYAGIYVDLLSVGLPGEIFKHAQFAFFVVVLDGQRAKRWELCAQSFPEDVAFFLGELHVHYF